MNKVTDFVKNVVARVRNVSPSRVAAVSGVVNHVAVLALVVVAGHANLNWVVAGATEVVGVTAVVNQWLKGRSTWEQVIEQIGATK